MSREKEGKGRDKKGWCSWEVFIQPEKNSHYVHAGSVKAPDAQLALHSARDLYTRRKEGRSIWVVRTDHIIASKAEDEAPFFDPADDKIYRYPNFYKVPRGVKNI